MNLDIKILQQIEKSYYLRLNELIPVCILYVFILKIVKIVTSEINVNARQLVNISCLILNILTLDLSHVIPLRN